MAIEFNADFYLLSKFNQLQESGQLEQFGLTDAASLKTYFEDNEVNAQQHYLDYGMAEGLNPSAEFDTTAYLTDKLAELQNADKYGDTYADFTLQDVVEAFQASGLTALEHFNTYGAEEGLEAKPVGEDGDGNDGSGVEGESFRLTEGADDLTGDADNNTFDASIGQNDSGYIVNTLSSADNIDGGAGNDTLDASLSQEAGIGGETLSVQPTTSSVENINVEARSSSAEGQVEEGEGAAGTVNLDAKDMTGVNTFGSDYSDGNLIIQNVNTLDDNGNARNTESMTVRMDHTSNMDSIDDASDLTVLFDDDYLLAGERQDSATVSYEVMNQDAWDLINRAEGRDDVELLDGVFFDTLSFDLNGEEIDLTDELGENGDGQAIRTHEELVDAINSALDAKGLSDKVTAKIDGTFTERTAVETGEERDGPRVTLESTEGNELGATEDDAFLAQVPEEERDVPASNRYDRAAERTIEGEEQRVTVNVELEKVGRAGEGGNLIIGGKSRQDVDGQENGIQVFNVEVQGDASQPSNLGFMSSTNDTLEAVNIATDAERAGSGDVADLTVRGVKGTDGNTPFGNASVVDAGDFEGNLTIGTVEEANGIQLTADGGGDVTFNGTGSQDILTGGGTDTLNLTDQAGNVSTGGGNDTVTLTGDGVSQLTMYEVQNVVVDTGAGNDTVNVNGEQRYDINTGAGSDFVNIDAEAVNAASGNWTFGKESASDRDIDTTIFNDRVLYNAELTVTFAGFESTVDVETDAQGNFVATQDDINASIINAIESNPELNKLLNAKIDESSLNELNVRSLINGENGLSVDINQPNVVAEDADEGDVEVRSNDVSALIQGLIETEGGNSASYDSAEKIANAIENGSIGQDGLGDYFETDLGGSSDADSTNESDVNFSTVNVGTGANDLVAFDSNENSANVLEIDGVFGKTSVVNFHDDAPSDVDSAEQVGNHAIDFTAFLDNKVDPSDNDNSLSENRVATTLNIAQPVPGFGSTPGNSTAEANSVNMLRFTEAGAGTEDAVDWEGLNAGNLVAALNGDDEAAQLGNNGINENALNADTSTTNLVGNTQQHIVMVENADNVGEYKVFQLSSTMKDVDGTMTTEGQFDTSAEELGTLDFGASINFNLVGSETWEDDVKELMEDADGVVPTTGEYTLQEAYELGAGDLADEYTLTDAAVDFGKDQTVADVDDAKTDAQSIVDGATNADQLGDLETSYSIEDSLDNVAADEKGIVAGAESYTLTNKPEDVDYDELTEDEQAVVDGAENSEELGGESPSEVTVHEVVAGTDSGEISGTDGEQDLFVYHVNSDQNGAFTDIGEQVLSGYNQGEDKVLFVDDLNEWSSVGDFVTSGISPNEGDALIKFNEDPEITLDDQSLEIMGAEMDNPFDNDLGVINNVDFEVATQDQVDQSADLQDFANDLFV